jgi:lipoprotein-anchoring transpeptidase ErfK/SrfK
MRTVAAVLAAFSALGVVLVSSSGAGAAPTRPMAIRVVGSGPVVWSHVAVRAKPTESSRRLRVLNQFRPNYQPQYVLALSKLVDRKTGKTTWYRISTPGRPNGQAGWVRAASVHIRPVTKRLIVDRGLRRFQFWDGNRLVRTGKIAVGAPGAETPTGLFYVQSKFVPNAPILGAYAFETSAYSKLSDWPGGGVVGVHGTPWPELLGQAVSHGCIRLHNDDVQYLRTRVPLGMPIRIVA